MKLTIAQMRALAAELNGNKPTTDEVEVPMLAKMEDNVLRKTDEYLAARDLLKAKRKAEGYRF